jgi:hypothetical protein
VVPLLGWYHASFDTEPDITGWAGIPPIEDAMMDFRVCKWPQSVLAAEAEHGGGPPGVSPKLAALFDRLNDDVDSNSDGDGEAASASAAASAAAAAPPAGLPWAEVVAGCAAARARGEPVISFSHFLPRLELIPEKRFLFLPTLSKAVGSDYLRARVAEIGPTLHLFGHTHFGWDATLDDGVRYVQAPLSYPAERKMRLRSIELYGFPEVRAGQPRQPLCLWDPAGGTGSAGLAGRLLPASSTAAAGTAAARRLGGHWSRYYETHARTPENTTDLAPYVASNYKRIGPQKACSACNGSGSYKGRGSCRICKSTGRI